VVNIVLLTNQERLVKLFNGSEIQKAGKVHVASGIHEALSAISPQRQNLLCIQERLGEMSGELLAYRMAEELKGKKVKIVLFGAPETFPLTGKKPFHAVLDSALSDNDLNAAILEILSTPAARTKKKKATVKNRLPPQAEERKTDESEPPIPTDDIDDVVEIKRTSPFREVDASLREPTSFLKLPKNSFHAKLESALNEASSASAVPQRETPLLSPEPFAEPLRATWGKPSLHERVLDRLLKPKLLMILGAVSGCFLALVFFLFYYQQKPDGKAVVPNTSSSITGAGGQDVSRPFQNLPGALPSFLPHQAPDSDYSKANPGWERYQGPLTEFRIFREKGLIRAIQIIDRGGQGVSPGLLSSVLNEMSGSRQYVIETTEQKGSYLVEKGTVTSGDRIIVYRKEPERFVKAFVLDLK
jgi:hypothetical protein